MPLGRVIFFLPALLLLAAGGSVANGAVPGRIEVSPGGHFLQFQDGTPFFWLGDTAWLLTARLDREETERYLADRQRKGFNVVQVSVLHGADIVNAYGGAALIGRDPARPNAVYWDHVDWVVSRAAERGIYVAIVPAWGAVVKAGVLNENNVAAYAAFLARRYRDRPNVIWLAGGDLRGDDHAAVWRQMGRTLRAEDPNHPITFHPFGRTQSSQWFHEEAWLDFNMFQSGHRRYDQDTDSLHRYGEDNWRYARADYERKPAKPVIDGEPSYENIPQGLHDTKQPYWTADDCRRYAYWSVFAGAFGHTYGDNAIMQFHKPGAKGSYGPRNYWYAALEDPGAGQMQFLKRLILSRPFFERVPDQSVIAGENGTRYDYVMATRGTSYLFAYAYTGRPFEVRLGALSGKELRAWWYSPRDGVAREIGTFPNRGTRRFAPPGEPRPGNDWVLVLDDAARRFRTPGK